MNILSSKGQDQVISRLANALCIIRERIGGHLPDEPEVKDDKTLVTYVDRLVEKDLCTALRRDFPDVGFMGEEGTVEGGDGRLSFVVDPLDGTRAFSCGLATSTIIVGVYDAEEGQIVGCIVGEAATGRIWFAFGDWPTQLCNIYGDRLVSVNPRPIDEQSTIFLDVPHGFQRKDTSGQKRWIITHDGMVRLFERLKGRKLAIPGSNGLIQALVANGGQMVAGSITTAIGGPWDVCGVKLVLNAGGAARAFSVEADQDRAWLIEKDPLNIMDYDVLVCGNSVKTVDTLSSFLAEIG